MTTKTMEKMMPQNIEAEEGVLGSILIDPTSFDLIQGTISPDDFSRYAHNVIFEAILNLSNKRVTPDFITLIDELTRVEKLEEIGGSGYIASLTQTVPTSGNIKHYAQIVTRLAILRRLIHAAGEIAALGYTQDPEAYEKAEKILFDVKNETSSSAFKFMPELVNSYMSELDFLFANKGTLTGITSGYHDLDRMLGGFQKSDLILLAARPGMGKSAAMLCFALNAALAGKRVAICSLEMGSNQLLRRLFSMRSKIDMQRLRAGWIEDNEWENIANAAGQLTTLPIAINDVSGNPVSSMRSQLRRLIQKWGKVDIFFVDYIGLIPPDVEEGKKENLVQEITRISQGLKNLAREFDIPVIALCQLSRAVENRQSKTPTLSDLRDSGSLEANADIVIGIYREDYYANLDQRESSRPNTADFLILKQRNGPQGVVSLFFKGDETAFYPLEHALNQHELEEEEAF